MVAHYRSATLVLALLSQRGRASVSRQNAVELVVGTQHTSVEMPRLEGRRRLVVEDDAGKLTEITLMRLTIRAISLSLIFLPVASSAWLALLVPLFRRRCWYVLLRQALGRAGAAFVKWAQWSATRADLFPEALCRELGKLQASAPAHAYAHTAAVIIRATGESPESYFESFEREPVASGSIAQVHRANIGGRAVAVKVRHPHIALRLALDASLMVAVARTADLAVPKLRLAETMSQFSETLGAQARLDVEALQLKRFRRRFRRWRDVSFPEPLFASPALLVESFERGCLVNSLRGPVEPSLGAFLVNRGEDIYLKMLLVDRVMHADLHPGNLLWDGNRLVLVDAGMVASLSSTEAEAFVGLIEALGAADAPAAARCLRLFSPTNAHLAPKAVAAFDADVAALFRDKCGGYGTGVDFGDVVRAILDLIRRHRVRIDANYATLVINALCLDGMARDLYPSYSVLDGAKPLLEAHRRLCSTRGLVQQPPAFGRFVFGQVYLPIAWRLKKFHDKAILRRIAKTHSDAS